MEQVARDLLLDEPVKGLVLVIAVNDVFRYRGAFGKGLLRPPPVVSA